MKRTISFLLSLALLLALLPACAQSAPEPDPPAPEPEAELPVPAETAPEPDPEPEPEEEPDDFTPVVEMRDILFRLLMDAAYPDWMEHMGRGDIGEIFWTYQKDITEDFYGIPMNQYVEYVSGFWHFCDYEGQYGEWSRQVLIFLADSEEGAAELVEKLENFRAERLEQFQSAAEAGNEDAAEAVEVWENAQTTQAGRYAALIATDHTADAILLFPRIINDPDTQGSNERWRLSIKNKSVIDSDPDYPDRIRFTPPGKEDMSLYDTSAILAAWEAGDPSALSGDDREIYDAAEVVLSEIIQDGMTDLEKETAVYDWIVENVDYDWSHMDVLAETDRRSYGPYGGLVNRSAVCLGYAASFQLLMDMSGIECITIVGASFSSTEDHAWNQVKLHGEWYCVDATWDANSREIADDHEWRNFNLTSDEMALNHQWDYANTPEATAEDRGGAA